MTVETATIHNHLVMRDDVNTWRWYDAFGPNVAKYIQDFTDLPVDDTTGDPVEFVNTIVEAGGGGDSTATLTDVAGGALLITTDNAEDDGYKMQLGDAGGGENVSFAGDYPMYLGTKFKINDVDETDVLVGFCVTDTACLDAVTDGMYFRSIDGSSTLYFVLEKDSAESTTSATTLTDDTYVTLEAYYDGNNVEVYVDGTLAATVADSDTNMPDDELLRLTIEFLTGEDAANTMTMPWIRYIQIQG